MSLFLKLNTYLRLGLGNITGVAIYRLGLRTGLHPVIGLQRKLEGTKFFLPPLQDSRKLQVPDAWNDTALFFGWKNFPLGDEPPQWHHNPFNGMASGGHDKPWWKLADFSLPVGDIKTVWEPSRFDWVVNMAQRAAMGEEPELVRLNSWLADWCQNNPAYLGSNWKCGQEASIHVMHLLLATRILGQDTNPAGDLVTLVEAHLARIQPTLAYAMAQDNNHGTSEAAAMFMGGSLCETNGISQGAQWCRDGRHWLENRMARLVAPDGSFSQHSLNYHRMLLDTICLVELWRQWQNLPAFSQEYLDRARLAAEWLYHMIDAETGDGPNIGANDGANLLPLTNAGYRDFRPTVQLAMALFADQRAYPSTGSHGLQLEWMGVPSPDQSAPDPGSRQFDYGGFSILRKGPWKVLLKYPRYAFRPHHCDALHLDLEYKSRNILRDAGSFSYNCDQPWLDYFPGTSAHNTIEFDGRDQMPAMGRFLRGAWLKAENVTFNKEAGSAGAAYTDWKGAYHSRKVQLGDDGLLLTDQVKGFGEKAILRWRLEPGEWTIVESSIRGENTILAISADVEIVRMEIVEGWESRYYLKKTKLQVVEVEIRKPGTISTKVTLADDPG